MMTIVPLKQLTKHKRLISVLVVAFFLCSFHLNFFRNTPVTDDGENRETSTESTLPAHVLPALHDIFVPKIAEAPQCGFTNRVNSSVKYVVNVTYTDLSTSESAVFKNHTKRVRIVTQEANNLLGQVMTKKTSLQDPFQRRPKLKANLLASRLRVNIDGYLYIPGGHWIPTTCKSKWKVAIIIPFRDRSANLHTLLRNLVPFLLNQKLEFGIFVAEQGFSEVMNRGEMRNIGYQLASYDGTGWDCFIFHDVDYIPMNATNYYGCDEFPKHYAIHLEEFNYGNPYVSDFGGVVGLTQDQIVQANGYSNMYWGWGGEDDDFFSRLRTKNFNVTRSDEGYYRTLPHQKKKKSETCNERFCLVRHASHRMDTDGLSSIRYPAGANITLSTLYTNISVDIRKEEWSFGYKTCHITKNNNYTIALFFVLFYVGIVVLAATCALVSIIMFNPDYYEPDSQTSRSKRPY